MPEPMMAIDAGRRARRLEHELEALRPLGETYVLRQFAGQLGRADAEDAVAEVIARLHCRIERGHSPDNLRAAFLTAVRNAAIDQLRSRSAKPTVALEAAYATPAEGGAPSELAESRENAAVLQDALARMRGRYREAILLRFGLGLTVPEIASHLEISLPAAKKLVLRATRQVKDRYLAIEEAEFCPEMQQLARRSLFEREASGLASEAEAEVLRAHFAHCGSCRSFLAGLHEQLHDLGSAALLGTVAVQGSGVRLGFLDRLGEWLGGGHGAHLAVEKGRQLALRISGAVPSDGAASGALFGSGQKIATICTAGAATTATCLFTGVVGVSVPPAHSERQPPAKSVVLARKAPPTLITATASSLSVPSDVAPPTSGAGKPRHRTSTRSPRPVRARAQAAAEEFGLEGGPVNNGSASGEAEGEASAPVAASSRAGSLAGSSDASTPSGSGSSSASGGGGGVGFEG